MTFSIVWMSRIFAIQCFTFLERHWVEIVCIPGNSIELVHRIETDQSTNKIHFLHFDPLYMYFHTWGVKSNLGHQKSNDVNDAEKWTFPLFMFVLWAAQFVSEHFRWELEAHLTLKMTRTLPASINETSRITKFLEFKFSVEFLWYQQMTSWAFREGGTTLNFFFETRLTCTLFRLFHKLASLVCCWENRKNEMPCISSSHHEIL